MSFGTERTASPVHTVGSAMTAPFLGSASDAQHVLQGLPHPRTLPRQPRARTRPTGVKTAICSFQPLWGPTLQEFPASNLAGPSPPLRVRKLPAVPPPPSHAGPSPPVPQPWPPEDTRASLWLCPPAGGSQVPGGHTQIGAHSLSSGLGEARMALCFLFTSSTFSEILSMNPRISSTCGNVQDDRSPVRGPGFQKEGAY